MGEFSRRSAVDLSRAAVGSNGASQALMHQDNRLQIPAEARPLAAIADRNSPHDLDLAHFVERDGMRFAGTHLIVDLWQATGLDDIELIEATMRRAASEAGATLLGIDLHHFSPNGGVTGVAILAESHISIHTWPECGYAAVDIFMCGDAMPHKAIGVLREAFAPASVAVAEHKRGIVA